MNHLEAARLRLLRYKKQSLFRQKKLKRVTLAQIRKEKKALNILKKELSSIRNTIISEKRKNGETLQAIGTKYGLTRERIRQIVTHER